MDDIYKDLNNWFKSKLKRPNKRFKKNSLEQPLITEDKYSKAIIQIVIINTIVFFGLWLFEYTPFYSDLFNILATPMYIKELAFKTWTLLTYGFVHESMVHFIMNMMGLLLMAKSMKSLLCNRQIWFVYIISVVLGGIFATLYSNMAMSSVVLPVAKLIGASAGILGLLTVFIMRYPYMRISFFFYPMTLKTFGYVNIALSIAMMLFMFNGGGGAAHIAGMAFGWLFYTRLIKKQDLSAFLNSIYTFISSLKVKKKKQLEYVPKYSSTFEGLVKKSIR
jgi:membrane associated rhomboid family serine protease